jgi:hypothetical protein
MNTFNDKVQAIKRAIEMEVSQEDLEGLQGKMLSCVNLIALSSELKARAVKDLADAELIAYNKHKDSTAGAMILKKIIEAEASAENSRFVLADRLNAGLTHVIDALRTMISLKKTEMENSLKA